MRGIWRPVIVGSFTLTDPIILVIIGQLYCVSTVNPYHN